MTQPHRIRYLALRQQVIRAARHLNNTGLAFGRSGNVSVRVPGKSDSLLITPSGVQYERLRPADIALLRKDGTWSGRLSPSSEWPVHAAIAQAYPEANAIVHCHSPNATALACLRQEIPPFHYMNAKTGGASIPCTPYATPGSEELAKYAVEALKNQHACLLANHGQIVFGKNLSSALELAGEVEQLAHMYILARSIGEPVLLTAWEMREMLVMFQSYGT